MGILVKTIVLIMILALLVVGIIFGVKGMAKLKYRNQRVIWGLIFLTPWMIGFLLFFLKPFIESFYYSFFIVTPSKGKLDMKFDGLGRYIAAFRVNVDFVPALIVSIRDTLLNLPVILILSLLISVVLNTNFKGRTFARAVFFIPVILNSVAVETAMGGGEALRVFMEQSGLGLKGAFDFEAYLIQMNLGGGLVLFLISSVNRIYAIITLSGVQILLFLAGLQSVPRHLYEAAKIEGATQYEIFWKITLPMVSPIIVTASVYTIIDTFLRSPVTNVIQSVFQSLDYGMSAAMSWIYFGVTAMILIIVLGILSKVVFYYDE